ALDDESWVEAIQEELLQFKLLNVWTLVDFPLRKRAIGTKWVYRNKRVQRGIIVRNKARLVAQGHRQEKGIGYNEVFAPVARIEAIMLFLAYASFMDFTMYQMDVKSAFLYGTIEEEVFVSQPPEFPDRVYKVKENQEKDKIGSKPDKKREAYRSPEQSKAVPVKKARKTKKIQLKGSKYKPLKVVLKL
nr:retrovirus-related Pol polyprotein from transposon TNT 1-94 [Tanacetum cinerariifolium]